jgi:hypothetical protein
MLHKIDFIITKKRTPVSDFDIELQDIIRGHSNGEVIGFDEGMYTIGDRRFTVTLGAVYDKPKDVMIFMEKSIYDNNEESPLLRMMSMRLMDIKDE